MRGLMQYTDSGLLIQTTAATIYPAWFDLDVQVGTTFSLPISWLDDTRAVRDLSTATVSWTIKQTWNGAVHATWATGAGGVITCAASAPNIQVTVPAATTAAYTTWTRAIYRCDVTVGTTVTRILEGMIRARQA